MEFHSKLFEFQVNIFQIHATQCLGYCLMEKYLTFHIKFGKGFSLKETVLMYPTVTNFTQKKRKAYEANDLYNLY